MTDPRQFSEPGFGPDYRIGHDSAGPPNDWRVRTPPAGEDGTVPDVRLTLDTQTYPTTSATGSAVPYDNPQVRPSTFDIPDNEMG